MRCEFLANTGHRLRIIHLMVVLTVGNAASTGSFLNMNIKSRALSSLLRDGNGSNHTVFGQRALQDALEKILHVDLSGSVRTKVFGPPADMSHDMSMRMGDGDSMDPLVEMKGPHFFPALFVGCHYDFANSRFGPTSFDTAVQWEDQRGPIPFLVQFSNRRNLFETHSNEQECLVQLNPHNGPPIRVLAEYVGGFRLSRLSCLLPLHRRISYEVQMQPISNNPERERSNALQNQDWWLPNVSIRPSGAMESLNSAVVRHPLDSRSSIDRRHLGIRFMVRRRLDWGSFPSMGPSIDDDVGTTLVFELQELGAQHISSLHLRIQTLFERPLESFRLSVTQTIMPHMSRK
jgi:hypothetical protein